MQKKKGHGASPKTKKATKLNRKVVKSVCWDNFHTVVKSTMTRFFIWGPPGVGKSHMSHDIGQQGSQEMPYQVTLNEDVVAQEIIGHYVPVGDHFEWHDGPGAAAMRRGVPLIINEIARASGAVQDMLLGMLDDFHIANIALPNGERLRPAKGFRVFATANSSPDGLDPALNDRFDAVIHVTEPHPELVAALNKAKAGMGDYILDTYKDPDRAISPRRAFAFLQLLASCKDAAKSSKIIFADRSEDFLMAAKARGIVL